MEIGSGGRGRKLRFGDGATDFVRSRARACPVVRVLVRRRGNNLKRLTPGIGGDGGKPFFTSANAGLWIRLVILSKRIDDGIRGA